MEFRTLQDAAGERIARDAQMFARWDRAAAKRRARFGMTCDEAGTLAAATDPRIGVLCRKGRAVFYAVISDEVVESREIGDVVAALNGGGA